MDETETRRKIAIVASRVRLADFLKQHDKLRLKRIEPATAIRALDAAGLRLSESEAAWLTALYRDEFGLFDCGRFIIDFNDTKPAGYYERAPLAGEGVAGMTASDGASGRITSFTVSPIDGGSAGFFVPLSDSEWSELTTLQGQLRSAVAARGLVLKSFLRDYDAHRRGVVTVSRFKREMSSCFPALTAAQLDLLAKAYATADSADVRYMVLHNDVTPGDEAVDTGSRGVIGISLTTAELEAARGGGTGASKSAASPARTLASSGGFGGGAAGGAGATASAAPTSARGAAPVRLAPSPERTLEYKCVPSDDVAAIEANIIRQVFERRIRTRELFADFDPLRKGYVTRSQFARGLRSGKFDAISPAGVEALARKYLLPHIEPAGEIVCYAAFCDFVDEAFTEKELEKDPTKALDSFAHTVVTSPHPRFVRPAFDGARATALAEAIDGIKTQIVRWRTYNVKAWLRGYDKASEGMVTETQFLRVLAAFNLVPGLAPQREALLDYFRGKGVKSHMIDYRAFLAEVYTDGVE